MQKLLETYIDSLFLYKKKIFEIYIEKKNNDFKNYFKKIKVSTSYFKIF